MVAEREAVRPFVSVVIATRDRVRLVPGAVASCLEQDYPADRYEVVVVDDGSREDTTTALASFAQRTGEPVFRSFTQDPKNANAARNRGIAHARGSLIAVFDHDQVAPPTWLGSLVSAAQRHPEAMCLGGPVRMRYEGRPPRLCARCWPGEGGFERGPDERSVANVMGGNMIARREAFGAIGPFDESLLGHGEETEWMVRLIEAGGTIVYVPSAPVWHLRTREQLRLASRLRKAAAIGRAQARFWARCGPAWERVTRSVGMPVVGRRSAWGFPRALAHAALRRCSGGLTDAAITLGFAHEEIGSRRADREHGV
jgi:GT2 family glycosyltransferase